MKVIGLIGGMSWESSVLYYQILNRKTREILGGSHSSECLMYSVDFGEIALLQHQGDWETLEKKMIAAAQRLERGGADIVLICTNTMHKMAEAIEQNINIPLLHIVDSTAAEIQKKSYTKLGMLATQFSMEEDFLKKRYKTKYGIEITVPEEDQRNEVHRIIYEELVKGIIKESSKQYYLKVIGELVKNGAEAIILGCTEIELLIKQGDVSIDLFATAQIHAENAVEWALTS
ncbi:aspartate/glutamate racemase family protein [Chryseobacterium sp. G0162]|uniref:aspartate/glutamate racemase family protein n=1 Tax=unclassified Chryseobacterium TaxID=2593645 RepID=UPI000F4DAC9D|nr:MULTISPECIES: aspartate/glutamate racemase family protein [unclassified Chryseobacterium]AZB10983.1 aspartate/glutamate racemase family protein [Chryseobacterium sp. G0162]